LSAVWVVERRWPMDRSIAVTLDGPAEHGTADRLLNHADRVSKISSAILVHADGLGSLSHSLIHLWMAASNSVTLRVADRRSLRLVSSADQRSTRTATSTWSSLIFRGAPGRGVSASPSSRPS